MFRLYQPSDFAPWAATLAIVSVVGGLSTLRYELAIVVERDPLEASALFWLALLLAVAVGTSGGLVVLVGTLRAWVVAGVPLASYGPSMAAWLVLVSLNQPLMGWALHRGAFLDISIAQIGNAVVMSGVQ
ncbi:MAG: hypothetical protein ACRELB_12525, partial [Polyangiaceae bacterium]